MPIETRTCRFEDLAADVQQLAQGYLTADDPVRVCYATYSAEQGVALKGLLSSGTLPRTNADVIIVTGACLISVAHRWDVLHGYFDDNVGKVRIDQLDEQSIRNQSSRAPWGMVHEVTCSLGRFNSVSFLFSAPQEAIQFAEYLRLLVARSRAESRQTGATQPNPPLIGRVSG